MKHPYFEILREKDDNSPITAKHDQTIPRVATRQNNIPPTNYQCTTAIHPPCPMPPSGNNMAFIQKQKFGQRKAEIEECKGLARPAAYESPGNPDKRRSSSKFGKLEKEGQRFMQSSKKLNMINI